MKKLILYLTGISIGLGLFAQDPPAKNYWTAGTAFTVQKHRWEPGLFSLSRYGISDHLELAAHPVMLFLLPQVQIKAGWVNHSGFRVATEHGFTYPTIFMQLVARKGIGGLISPELTIPRMLAIYNRVLVSYLPFEDVILTAHAGISFALKSDPMDKRGTIDLPLVYPRFAVYFNHPEFDLGVDFRGKFAPRFGWIFAVQNYILSGTVHNYFLENKGDLVYTSQKDHFRLQAGYRICYGEYPDGQRWHLLPDIDLIFGIGK